MKKYGCISIIVFLLFMCSWVWLAVDSIMFFFYDYEFSLYPVVSILFTFIAWGYFMVKQSDIDSVVGRNCRVCGGDMKVDQAGLMSNPVKHKYICRMCGREEID